MGFGLLFKLSLNSDFFSFRFRTNRIIALLRYCLDNYPNSLYWLTTHCKNGVNHTNFALSGAFPKELVDELCQTFQPTDWEVLKTDAIDLDCDFVWFDDNLFETEKAVLESHYVLDGFFKMNPKDPTMAKKTLTSSKASSFSPRIIIISPSNHIIITISSSPEITIYTKL